MAGARDRAPSTRVAVGCVAWLFAADGEEYALLEQPVPGGTLPETLTPAERAVAALAAEGLRNADIARRRGCSVNTVSKQLGAVYRKLGVGGRAGLQAWPVGRSGEP